MADAPLLSINRAGYCERLEGISPGALLKMGMDGTGLQPNAAETLLGITAGDIAAQALELALKGYVTFLARVSQTTNDTSDIILSDRGVTFGTGFARIVEVESISADGDNVTNEQVRYVVEGNDTLASAVLTSSSLGSLVTSGLTTAAVNPDKTSTNGLGVAGVGGETVRLVNSTGIRARYTGQSGDATTGTLIARVYPKVVQVKA